MKAVAEKTHMELGKNTAIDGGMERRTVRHRPEKKGIHGLRRKNVRLARPSEDAILRTKKGKPSAVKRGLTTAVARAREEAHG